MQLPTRPNICSLLQVPRIHSLRTRRGKSFGSREYNHHTASHGRYVRSYNARVCMYVVVWSVLAKLILLLSSSSYFFSQPPVAFKFAIGDSMPKVMRLCLYPHDVSPHTPLESTWSHTRVCSLASLAPPRRLGTTQAWTDSSCST